MAEDIFAPFDNGAKKYSGGNLGPSGVNRSGHILPFIRVYPR